MTIRSAASLASIACFLFVGLWFERTGGRGDLFRDLLPTIAIAWALAALGAAVVGRVARDADRGFLGGAIVLVWLATNVQSRYLLAALVGPAIATPTIASVAYAGLVALLLLGIVRATGGARRVVEAVQVASIVLLVFSVPRLLNTGGAE